MRLVLQGDTEIGQSTMWNFDRTKGQVYTQLLRFDELFSLSIILQPMSKDEVLEVQRLYPQIYIGSTSVLDAERVRAMLGKLRPKERKEALRGLALLAEAARKLSD